MNPDENPETEQPRDLERLRRLVEFLKEAGISEFASERDGEKISLKFAGSGGSSVDAAALASLMAHASASAPAVAPAAAAGGASQSAAPAPAAPEDEEASWHIVKSPIVGTFYESPSPGAAAFVTIGDYVENGQVLCIVEAMKLMNEIESDGAGEVVKRYVQNSQPVEYGQKLYALKPRG